MSLPTGVANAQVGDMEHCTDDKAIPAENIVSACTTFISKSFQQNWNLQFVPAAMTFQAHAYVRLKKYEKAEAILKAAITRYPAYSPAWEELGELLEKLKGPGLLMSTLDLMVRSNPGDSEVLNSACWARAKKGEQLDIALANCNESLRLSPGSATTLDSRAFVYLRSGNFQQTITDANAALAANPKQASSLYMRGLAKLKMGDATGTADIAASKTIDANISDTFASYGITP